MRTPHLRSLATAVLVLSVALSVSGCGSEGAPGDGDVSATDPASSGEPSKDPTAGTTTPPSEGLQKVRVVGQVVEDGDCVVVRDDNQITWTIAGELAADLVLHDRVQVTGAPDLRATGCGGSVVTATSVRVLPPVE